MMTNLTPAEKRQLKIAVKARLIHLQFRALKQLPDAMEELMALRSGQKKIERMI